MAIMSKILNNIYIYIHIQKLVECIEESLPYKGVIS